MCFAEDKFYELYTPEEKAKLYSAIGYQENEADLTLPKEVTKGLGKQKTKRDISITK